MNSPPVRPGCTARKDRHLHDPESPRKGAFRRFYDHVASRYLEYASAIGKVSCDLMLTLGWLPFRHVRPAMFRAQGGQDDGEGVSLGWYGQPWQPDAFY